MQTITAEQFKSKYGQVGLGLFQQKKTEKPSENIVSQVGNEIAGNQNPTSGALFSTSANDVQKQGALVTAGKTVANVVPDFVRTIIGAPVQTAGQVVQAGSDVLGLVKDSGGLVPAIKNLLVSLGEPGTGKFSYLPKWSQDFLKAVIPSAAQKIAKGDFDGAAQDISNHPFQQIAPFLIALEKGATGFDRITGGTPEVKTFSNGTSETPTFSAERMLQSTASKLASPVTNAIEKTTNVLLTAIDNLSKKPQEYFNNEKLQQKAISQLEEDYGKWTGQTKTGVKTLGKIEQRTGALNDSGVSAKTPQRILAEAKIVPETEGSKFRTAEQANNFRESIQPLNDAAQSSLQELKYQTAPLSIEELRSNTIKRIKSLGKTVGEEKTMIDAVNQEFDLLKERYGGETIDIADLGKEKTAYGKTVKFDSTKPFKSDVNYQIGKSMREAIIKAASDAGYKDLAQLYREVGDRLEAAKFLENLDGQTIKGGRLGKYVLTAIGSTLGQTFVGKLLGAAGGNILGELLIKNEVASPVKRLLLKYIENQSPEAYRETLKWLEEQDKLRSTRPQLPAPTPKPPLGSSENPIITPRYETSKVMSVPATKTLPTRNPKTGRMQTTYSSTVKK